ncbi:hypothetical protein MVEN_00522100 [Mycena venus]|uniref:DUF6533 domain-containing protein n=1 Tax=Mycena venus TaxID=2733690 RepID=A0A8H7D4D5_9AGAR|nr:hypothetical protein MVEN_00522100 [Mycena venus]
MRLRGLEFGAYAGLTFATCEVILTFRTECKYIWRNSQGSTLLMKLLYLFSRYFAFAVHITNTILVTLVNKYPIIPTHLCRIAVIYQGAVLFVMFGILDVILMIRVYALYNRPTYLAVLFLCLLACRFFVPAIMSYKGMPSQRFTPSCLVKSAGRKAPVYVFAGGELFVQLLVVGLTFARHIWANRGGWNNPLFSLLSRDGAMAFFAITIGMIAVIAVCLDPVDFSHLVFPGLVIIMSSAGSRLIINMQKMADPAEPEPVLTTMHSTVWSGRAENGSTQTQTTCVSNISSVNFN